MNWWWFIPLCVSLLMDFLGRCGWCSDVLGPDPHPHKKPAYLDNAYRIINFKACGCSCCVDCFCFPDFVNVERFAVSQPLRVFGEILPRVQVNSGEASPSPLFVVQRVHLENETNPWVLRVDNSPNTNMSPWTILVGRLHSFWNGSFLGDMLLLAGVNCFCMFLLYSLNWWYIIYWNFIKGHKTCSVDVVILGFYDSTTWLNQSFMMTMMMMMRMRMRMRTTTTTTSTYYTSIFVFFRRSPPLSQERVTFPGTFFSGFDMIIIS